MTKWWTSGYQLAHRKARGMPMMNVRGSNLSPFKIVLISIIVTVQLIAGVSGQCASEECGIPPILGGGTPTLSPDQTCYGSGESANFTCSGDLFGTPTLSLCVDGGWTTPYAPTCEESSCPEASAPVDGSVTPVDSNSLFDEIEFSCDDGFFLDGPGMAVCTGTGLWSPSEVPTCTGNCTVPIITNGDVTLYDDVLQEGSQVMITCSEGYTLTGVTNVTCHNEEWNPDVGECLENCPSPTILNSTFATDQGDTDHGDYIIVTCDEGYTSGTGENVSEPLTCGNGSWSDTVYCYANCPSISAPVDGYTNSSLEPFYHTRTVAFNCSVGFTLVGESSSTCDDGSWTNDVPECKADCLIPYIENSNLNDTTNSTYVPHDSNTTVTCSDGYTFGYGSDFDGVLTCDDGTMDDSGIQCLESCNGPDVANSNWADRDEMVPYGGPIVVDCDTGFTSGSGSEQNETLICQGGSWNASVLCYENCPSISAPTGGNMYPNTAPLFHTNTVYFNCSETYLFVGESDLTCENGTWSDPVPECKASCPGPDVDNSNFANSSSLTQHGGNVSVLCDDGFTSGSGSPVEEIVYCDDGSFNRTVYCYGNCPNVTEIDNGILYIMGPPHFYGDTFNVTCQVNYTLEGNQTVTCQDGAWGSDFPECKADCSDPGTPINGSQTSNSSYTHGGRVFYECDEGYDTLGSSVITCNNGSWSAPVPICEEETLVDLITLSCWHDSYTVQVPYALLDGLQPEELVLENNVSCTGVNESSGFVNITSKLGDCGTTLTEETITDGDETLYYDIYKNRVIAYSPTGFLRGPSVDIPISCTYNRKGVVEAVSYQLENYTISRSLTNDGTYQFQFSFYGDSTFSDVIDGGAIYVGLGEEVFLGVSLVGGAGELQVTTQTCWATPSSRSSDNSRWDLISGGCKVDSSVKFYNDTTRALFSLTSFRFLNQDDSVYIHCDVLVCEIDNPNCVDHSSECNGGGGRRRRRRRSAAHVGPKGGKRVRVGPIKRIMNSVYRRDVRQEYSSEKDSTSSIPESITVYIVVIASLATACLVLVASLTVVTTRLLIKRNT